MVTVRPNPRTHETAPKPPLRKPRRRWRFRPRGILNLILLAVFLVNLYVLADGLVRLVKTAHAERVLRRRLAERAAMNRLLEKDRDRMAGDDYLREQARRLGFVAAGEEVVPLEAPPVESPVKRRRSRPSPPY